MRKNDRVKVEFEGDFYHGYEGKIIKKCKFFNHVKLEGVKRIQKYADDELELVRENVEVR